MRTLAPPPAFVRLPRALVALAFVLIGATAHAAELKILATGSMAEPLKELGEDFSQQTGHTLTFSLGTTGVVMNKLKAGEKADVIERESREAALRQATETPAAELASAGGVGGRSRPGAGQPTAVPSVEEMLGADAAEALRSRGMTADQFAQRLGRGSWADYVKLMQTQEVA